MTNGSQRIVHHGFDTIEVAFQGFLPPSVRRILALLQGRAREQGQAQLATIGEGNLECHVFGAGLGSANHNYTWRIQSASGLIWAWIDSQDIEQWNGRVKIGAETLLALGYRGAVAQVRKELAQLGAVVKALSIGRADYCMDFLAPEFRLSLERLVCHHRMRGDTMSPEARALADANNIGVRYTARRCNSIRLGHVSLLQLAIYSKSKEARDKQKDFWWEAWKLDKSDTNNIVWRVEIRAGKELLRDRYNIRTFEDLEKKIGDVYAEALRKVRLLADDEDERTDKNVTRARLDELWKLARETIDGELAWAQIGAQPDRVKFLVKERAIKNAAQSLIGAAYSWLTLTGAPAEWVQLNPGVLAARIHTLVKETIDDDPEKAQASMADKRDRYHFVAPQLRRSMWPGGMVGDLDA